MPSVIEAEGREAEMVGGVQRVGVEYGLKELGEGGRQFDLVLCWTNASPLALFPHASDQYNFLPSPSLVKLNFATKFCFIENFVSLTNPLS